MAMRAKIVVDVEIRSTCSWSLGTTFGRFGVALTAAISWVGAAFPAHAAAQTAADTVDRDGGAGRVAERKQQPVPQRNAEIGRAGNVQAESRSRAERAGNQRPARRGTIIRAGQ